MDDDLLYRDEYYKIVNAAIKVWKYFRFGQHEKTYENSLVVELRNRGFKTQQQTPFKVFYEGELVGEYQTDLIFENIILLEIKTAEAICEKHVQQVVHYLKITGHKLGIILNFGPNGLEHRRVVL